MCENLKITNPKQKFKIPEKNDQTIAEMSVEELKNFLEKFYENDAVKNYCSCLIDYYKTQRAPGTETQQETDTTQHVAI